ncbi:MAG: YggS family pyridoxal phosphate-dependent enzyme [Candidatus Omnitrophica bacterium]|nr:YggS family pyridoxal phosphate-dependent enzyme [Candidatus Omnitrophota bacterium]
MSSLRERVELVRQRINEACQRSGRDPTSVTLVCVTKGLPPETIEQAVALGITDIGENRVQEARAKRVALGSRLQAPGNSLQPRTLNLERFSDQPSAFSLEQQVRWHLVGHLQSNKAKHVVELFDVIHSVDSQALVKELDRQAAKLAQGSRLKALGKSSVKPLEVFIQVNVSGEATKFGCALDEAPTLVRAIAQLPHLCLKGLMTLAPFTDDPERVRPYFRQLRMLRDSIQHLFPHPSPITHHPSLLLSMGMSQDFEVAIEEGADLVRIGSAIFSGP